MQRSAEQPPLTLGTAGHVDHGKTELVRALTGVDTDRLPAERDRGISIELGFASLELPSGRSVSIVDVPGHERFVRTMVSGATGVDLFLMVVAADDRVMPQTREHLAVLEMLDVPGGVVAITKTDLVAPEGVGVAVGEVRAMLAGGRYEDAPIVPVCAPAGERLGELVAAIDRLAAAQPGRAGMRGELRLHVDRSFSLRGAGTVVTGTLWSGELHAGDEVRIEPSRRTARVRSVEVHGSRHEVAAAGQRVAVNLIGVERREVERGDLLTARDAAIHATYVIDAAVEILPAGDALAPGTRVQVHHGTRASAARVAPIEGDVMTPGQRSYAQLRLEQPLLAAAGDRFVLRRVAPPDTIGGGVVIDASPRKHGASPDHVERLALLEAGDPLERLSAELSRTQSGMTRKDAPVALLDELRARGRAVAAGCNERRYFGAEQLSRATDRVLATLDELGGRRPVSRGALADAAGLAEGAVAAVLEDLVAAGRVVVRGPGFQPAEIAEREDPRADHLIALLLADGLEPRGVEALGAAIGISAEEARELLEESVLDGRLTRLRPGLYCHPEALREAEHEVVTLCERDGSVTIAQLRDALGTSRKYAQALLEHFDGRRLTRRQGDDHVLRRRQV